MKTLKKDVELKDVLSCYERENQGSKSFDYARGLLAPADEEGTNRVLYKLQADIRWRHAFANRL
jgi:hypothetical protein